MRLRAAFFIGMVVLAAGMKPACAERELVLVAHADSPVRELTLLEVRKLYLGFTVAAAGHRLTAFRRDDDKLLNDTFLQSVLAMSERSYERRLLSSVLKYGAPRPVQVNSAASLGDACAADPTAVGYMWRSEAELDPRIRVLQVLWREN